MRNKNRLSGKALLLLLPVFLTGACTKEGVDGDRPLPEGKYPVVFSSQVYGLKVNTRSVTENNAWAGGEQVTVKWGTKYSIKNYSAASDGSLTCTDDPFYWTKESETVTACYQQGERFTYMPSSFWIKPVQSTMDGYTQSDFIMACQTVRFADTEKKLKFRHLAVKVIVNIKGEGTVDVSNAEVSFINLSTSASIVAANPSDDLSGISVGQAQVGMFSSKVTPYVCTTPANGFQKSVLALLTPHYANGLSSFIRIELDGNNCYYTPSPDDCDLQSGKQYTYNITVKRDGATVELADMQLTESDEWTDEGTEDISSTPIGQVL